MEDSRRQIHEHPTRHAPDMYNALNRQGMNAQGTGRSSSGSAGGFGPQRASPMKKDQKHVVFQLIDPQDPRIQARLPMRVMISSHDSTDSIITTVKNFYGLYDYGVSFENREGISIIAAYGNFENDMVVYVRTVAQPPGAGSERAHTMSPRKPTLGAAFEMRAPAVASAHSPSRARHGMRSMSPNSEYGRRSVSAVPGKVRGSKSKSKENSVLGDGDGYSSDEGANASVTSSRRSKTEQVNAEISVDNIVEGGRRKRAFESSVRRECSRDCCALFTKPLRNYHCLCRRKSRSRRPSLRSHRSVVVAQVKRHLHMRTLRSRRSPTRSLCLLRRATAAATTCNPPCRPTLTALMHSRRDSSGERVQCPRLTRRLVCQEMALCQRQIPLSVASSLTKTSRCS